MPRTPCRLEIAPCASAAVARLEAELGLSHVTAQVLARRGFAEPGDARAWLAADEAHPADAFAGLDTALALVRRHVDAGTRITVHGDYDVDGVCATAILVRALQALGAQVDWYLPSRLEDGYGLREHTIRRLAAAGTRLLVTADCAITAVEEVALARALGLDVLVTDHHSPRADGALPDAPIVHPAVCGYPCADLCAAGVAHKLAEALGAPTAAEDLDLVALATVADVVPLRGENRRLVREGLHALRTTRKPGLRALMDVTRCDAARLDARAIGFRLAPRINAAGRLQRADAGLELVLCESRERGLAVAEELDRVNAERRMVEQRMLFEAEAQVREQAGALAYVVAGEGWHPGVAGIVASRIAERHHRPAVVIALDAAERTGAATASAPDGMGVVAASAPDGTGVVAASAPEATGATVAGPDDAAPAAAAAPGRRGTGSARSIPAFDLLGGLNACAEHLVRHGGHRAAAGLEIEADRIDAFRAAFNAHAASVLTDDDLVPLQRVDAIAAGGDVGHELAEELARLEPFGQGNPPVALLLPAAQLADPRPMGEGKHVRFTVEAGGVRARAVAFGCDGRLPVDPSAPADAVVRLELDHWNGTVEPRLVLRHAQPCQPPPVEVVGRPGDHLAAAFAELDRDLAGGEPDGGGVPVPLAAAPVDRRDRGIAGTLAALVATGERVLAVCADVPARLPALRRRLGGFALTDWPALAADPALAAAYDHVVALDPPPFEAWLNRATVLAWGTPELHFAARIHEREYALRDPLAALYRALRDAGAAQGEHLAALLRGEGTPRSAALGGRLLRVLAELDLVVCDPAARTVTVPPARRTELERSPAFRTYEQRRREGLAWLTGRTAAPARAA